MAPLTKTTARIRAMQCAILAGIGPAALWLYPALGWAPQPFWQTHMVPALTAWTILALSVACGLFLMSVSARKP